MDPGTLPACGQRDLRSPDVKRKTDGLPEDLDAIDKVSDLSSNRRKRFADVVLPLAQRLEILLLVLRQCLELSDSESLPITVVRDDWNDAGRILPVPFQRSSQFHGRAEPRMEEVRGHDEDDDVGSIQFPMQASFPFLPSLQLPVVECLDLACVT